MARTGARLFALVVAGALISAVACTTNHDALEKQPTRVAGGAGGVSGVGGQAPVSSGGGGAVVATGGHPDDEAPGKNLLTFMHGVVDAPSVVVCLAKVGADGVPEPFGSPLSDAPLDYGQSIQLADIAGADLASDVLQPFLIAGELDLVSGLDCASAIDRARAEEAAVSLSIATEGVGGAPDSPAGAAGAAGATSAAGGVSGEAGAGGAGGAGGAAPEVQARLRVRSLPAIPAGTLNGGRSYLLVATGCLGGSGYELAENGADYCGAGYSPQTPTVSLFFAAVSRATSVDHVGLQVLNGSLATDPIGVTSGGPVSAGAAAISIATNDTAGGLVPRPADVDHTVFDYGSARGFSLEISAPRKVMVGATQQLQVVTLLTEKWATVLASSGIDALNDGSNYVIVLLGPLVDAKPGPAFLNPSALFVVPADAN